MNLHRYQPDQSFPPYAYVPGVNLHPNHSGGYREGIAEPAVEPIESSAALQNEAYRFALDLFNHEYFWESHVYFEALWNAHSRSGSQADFLKAMIKLSAAGVKLQAGRKDTSILHFKRAEELFKSVAKSEGEAFLGFNLPQLIQETEATAREPQKMFKIHPIEAQV